MAFAEVSIAAIVELLAERWRTRCRDLDTYLRSTFGARLDTGENAPIANG